MSQATYEFFGGLLVIFVIVPAGWALTWAFVRYVRHKIPERY